MLNPRINSGHRRRCYLNAATDIRAAALANLAQRTFDNAQLGQALDRQHRLGRIIKDNHADLVVAL